MIMVRILSFLVNLTNARIGDVENVMSPVDCPTHRDHFHWPIIRGHYFKGAMRCYFSRDFSILERIIFGESGEDGLSGSVIFNHHNLFALPVPSKDFGIIYLTCPKALNDLLLHLNNTRYEEFRRYVEELLCALLEMGDDKIVIYSQNSQINIRNVEIFGGELVLNGVYSKDIEPLYILIKELTVKPLNLNMALGIVSDTIMNFVIRRALITKPGIKLKGMDDEVYRKVVDLGPWFEEEIPKFSVFVGTIMLKRNRIPMRYARDLINELKRKVRPFNIIISNDSIELSIEALKKIILEFSPIIMSARETIGKGLFDIKLLEVNNGQYRLIQKNMITQLFRNKNLNLMKINVSNLKESVKGKKVKIRIDEDPIKKAIEYFSELKNAIDQIHGKISAAPERIRRLGLPCIQYYYKIIKGESLGEGYPEMRRLIEELTEDLIPTPEPSIEYLSSLLIQSIIAELEFMTLKRLVQSYK